MLRQFLEGKDIKQFCKACGITQYDLDEMMDYDFIPKRSVRDKMAFYLDKTVEEIWPSLPWFYRSDQVSLDIENIGG